jgi:hypothetical protein
MKREYDRALNAGKERRQEQAPDEFFLTIHLLLCSTEFFEVQMNKVLMPRQHCRRNIMWARYMCTCHDACSHDQKEQEKDVGGQVHPMSMRSMRSMRVYESTLYEITKKVFVKMH